MAKYTTNDLLYLMARLRDPNQGCPWDLKQTSQTLIQYSIEEIYELVDAIESANSKDIQAELGDVLFQVVFLARIAEEEHQFDFHQIVDQLCSKLIRRHPHIFIDGRLLNQSNHNSQREAISEQQVSKNWEAIKAAERVTEGRSGLFDDVPLALPALLRAVKLQKRAATMGLDFTQARSALEKLKEEITELEEAMDGYQQQDTSAQSAEEEISDELGDVLFSSVNVARKLAINPESALRGANQKFTRRVLAVLDELPAYQAGNDSQGKPITINPELLDQLWQSVKHDD
ncbi:MAG: nucleoside triphosphate pyrophosphohydrolase [Actinobacteria bacterium TMED172]|nr:nucleoside triphosphate pyrophosphohydrolase [Cellvibrionales bacterium]OUW33321.1 MAG: nucleoside triphosphate pyrophosphohydrolase [Actinobacteria bacterium TMED172]|tara:strand:- start:1344 stop:2207 length:864 start_codon:yes stop_codon:yes gene_type:complete